MNPLRTETSVDIEDQRRFWNSWNAQYREKGGTMPEVNQRQAQIVIDWIARLGRMDLEILEVGCGTGWLCRRLVSFGRVVGTDLSDEVLDRSAGTAREVRFVPGDFFELEFSLSSFDVVVSLEVLAHVADQSGFVEKISLLMRPGGYLMIATQNGPVLERWSKVKPTAAGQIRNWVDAGSLKRLLIGYFEIAELRSICPVGDRGILRWVNAPKINRLLSRIVSPRRIEALKEHLFLGHTLMVLARKSARPD